MNQLLPKKIAVEGSIGAGKSTFSSALAEVTGYKLMAEPITNEKLLSNFYENPKRYAFSFQMHMLCERYNMERAGTAMIAAGMTPGAIYDRSMAGDTCFAEINAAIGNITPEEYEIYLRLYNTFKSHITYPDVLIYLDTPIPELKTRIATRARVCEQSVTDEYLQMLEDAYSGLLSAFRFHTATLVIRPHELDSFSRKEMLHGKHSPITQEQREQLSMVVWPKIVYAYNNCGDTSRFSKRIGGTECLNIHQY